MALVVEDGSGLATAESYLSAVGFRERAVALGLWYVNTDFPARAWIEGLSDDDVEAALRRGTMALDGAYHGQWRGRRLNSDQALDWPRRGEAEHFYGDGRGLAYSAGFRGRYPGLRYDGYAIGPVGLDPDASAELPGALKNALAHLAAREAARPGGLTPDSFAGDVKSESISGAVSVTYENGYTSVGVPPTVSQIVRPLLGGLTAGVIPKRRA